MPGRGGAGGGGSGAGGRVSRRSEGTARGVDALLVAPGAEPRRLDVPGAVRPQRRYLRSLEDCRRIIEDAGQARRAVVIGASFIGMEASAALRARGLDVHVVAPESKPMERVLGPQLGEHLRRLHERNGVAFHLGTSVAAIDDRGVRSEEHTSELQSLMRISSAVFCLNKKIKNINKPL